MSPDSPFGVTSPVPFCPLVVVNALGASTASASLIRAASAVEHAKAMQRIW